MSSKNGDLALGYNSKKNKFSYVLIGIGDSATSDELFVAYRKNTFSTLKLAKREISNFKRRCYKKSQAYRPIPHTLKVRIMKIRIMSKRKKK